MARSKTTIMTLWQVSIPVGAIDGGRMLQKNNSFLFLVSIPVGAIDGLTGVKSSTLQVSFNTRRCN